MRFAILLLAIAALVAKSHTQDAELDEIFSQLSSALKQDANINNKIDAAKEDIKAEISKAPQKRTQFLGAAKALNGAVTKLQSNDPLVILQGALNAVSGIAEFIPGGIMVASVLSLVSSVIGIVTGRKAEDTLGTVVRSAVRDESDSELIGLAKGAQQEIAAAFFPLSTYKDQKLDDKAANFLTNQIKIDKGIAILEMLAHRIGERKKSTDGTQQLNCYRLSLFYAQIATMRDLVINDLVVQLRQSGHNRFADSYASSLDSHKRSYKSNLEFYANPDVSEAGVVHLFYPQGHSNDSLFIQDFLKMAGVTVQPRKLELPIVYSLYSKYWYTQYLSLGNDIPFASSLYLKYIRGNGGLWRFRFEKRSDGYWAIKVEDYWMTLYNQYVTTQDSKPTDSQIEGHFVIMQFKDQKVITISSRKSPGYFWKGVSGNLYLVVSKGYNGEESLFTLWTEDGADAESKEAHPGSGSKKKGRKSRRKTKSKHSVQQNKNKAGEVTD